MNVHVQIIFLKEFSLLMLVSYCKQYIFNEIGWSHLFSAVSQFIVAQARAPTQRLHVTGKRASDLEQGSTTKYILLKMELAHD